MSRIRCLTLLLAVLCVVLCSCSDNGDAQLSGDNRKEVKIAVVLPKSTGVNWQRVMDWAQANIAQANDSIKPVYEFYNEDSVNIEATAEELSTRDDIAAIVGCLYSKNTQTLAYYASKTKKPVFTFSTSETLSRAFADKGFLYMLAETDVAQMELLLVKAARYGAQKVSLLTKKDDIYGETFVDWFAFQAVELGMEPVNSIEYTDGNIEKSVIEATANTDYLICAPANVDDAIAITKAYTGIENYCRLLFSDVAYSSVFVKTLSSNGNGIEGVSITDDVESGFSVAYKAKYGAEPTPSETYVYDAIMTTCYAERYKARHTELTMNDAIQRLLRQEATEKGQWTTLAMRDVFQQIESGATPAFSGASSSLDLSPTTTTVRYSMYTHWTVYDGQFIKLDYDNRSESGHSSAYAAWEWNKQYMQSFDDAGGDYDSYAYAPLKGRYAVIVAASNTWMNYRHQADALAFYQLLKCRGYDDDHILFIAEDDIAYNSSNPNQGIVIHTEGGQNVYDGVTIDYKLAQITPSKLQSILEQIPTTENDNVLLYWSGHGYKSTVMWGDDEFAFATLADTFRQMQRQGKFRKMLCFVETCYSGSLGEAAEGTPGLLVMTAANSQETSKTYLYSTQLATWLTNRFTYALLQRLEDNPDVKLRDLYVSLFDEVLGSHVTVYNYKYYGDMSECSMSEFLD